MSSGWSASHIRIKRPNQTEHDTRLTSPLNSAIKFLENLEILPTVPWPSQTRFSTASNTREGISCYNKPDEVTTNITDHIRLFIYEDCLCVCGLITEVNNELTSLKCLKYTKKLSDTAANTWICILKWMWKSSGLWEDRRGCLQSGGKKK